MLSVTVVNRQQQQFLLQFDENKDPINGGEGSIYFSNDRNYVLKFYWNHILPHKDPNILMGILQQGPEQNERAYRLFGWPNGIIVQKTGSESGKMVGITMPNVTRQHWFKELMHYTNLGFVKLPQNERGNFRGRVAVAIDIADAVRYLNLSGVAQADISGRNFLINPVEGRAVLIDLDGLVVPGVQEGTVLGTPGYMAPELIIGMTNGIPKRPTIKSDRHSLAVVLFELLLCHHPLLHGEMPKLSASDEEDMLLRMGREALYVHHPTDRRNAVKKPLDALSPRILGSQLKQLFEESFVVGLRQPDQRPQHAEYLSALKALYNDLVQCKNPECLWGWYPSLGRRAKHCSFCGTTK